MKKWWRREAEREGTSSSAIDSHDERGNKHPHTHMDGRGGGKEKGKERRKIKHTHIHTHRDRSCGIHNTTKRIFKLQGI